MVDLESIEGYPERIYESEGEAYVYVLRLFNERYYVGVTKNPKRRVISHARGETVSPHWVKQYPPVAVESMIGYEDRERAMEREREVTLALARHHGSSNVRGADWTAVDDPPPSSGNK